VTPDGVEALGEVALSNERVADSLSELTSVLLADQQDARKREDRRFKVVNRTLAAIAAGTVVALVLLGFTVWQSITRSAIATAQRECSDVVTTDVLGRLSFLAVQPRYRTKEDGTPVRDEAGRVVPLSADELLAQTESLRLAVDRSNHILTRISEVCYGPAGPDPTPLDGDPTR
jgi:hypothetical protein